MPRPPVHRRHDGRQAFPDRLEELTRTECLEFLERGYLGRVGLSWDALPVVLPVNYVLDRDRIVMRTGSGTKFAAALAGAIVAFEVDGHDAQSHTGWSVLVRGQATPVLDPRQVEGARRLPLRAWAGDAADRFVAVPCDLVTGRRIRGWYPTWASLRADPPRGRAPEA